MRTLGFAVAALASAVGLVAVPAGPANASGEALGCSISGSGTTLHAGGCSAKGSYTPKLYYITFGIMYGSGTPPYSWSFSDSVNIVSGCTSTSTSCQISVYGGGGTDTIIDGYVTEGGLTLSARALIPGLM